MVITTFRTVRKIKEGEKGKIEGEKERVILRVGKKR